MKTTAVRVTRTQKLTVTAYVDVPVVHDDDNEAEYVLSDLATTLVKAMDAVGHDVDWVEVSEVPSAYAHDTVWKAELAPVQEVVTANE